MEDAEGLDGSVGRLHEKKWGWHWLDMVRQWELGRIVLSLGFTSERLREEATKTSC